MAIRGDICPSVRPAVIVNVVVSQCRPNNFHVLGNTPGSVAACCIPHLSRTIFSDFAKEAVPCCSSPQSMAVDSPVPRLSMSNRSCTSTFGPNKNWMKPRSPVVVTPRTAEVYQDRALCRTQPECTYNSK